MNVLENLKAYVDGELSPAEKSVMERAIEGSPELREEVERLRDLSTRIAGANVTPEPTGYEALRAKLPTTKAAAPRFGLPRMLAYGMTGVVALFVLGTAGQFLQNNPFARAQQMEEAAVAASAPEGYVAVPSNTDMAAQAPITEMAPGAVGGAPSESTRAMKASPERERNSMEERTKMPSGAGLSAVPPPNGNELVVPFGGRDIIYDGSIGVEVPDVQKAVDEAVDLIQSFGGYVVNSNTSSTGEDQATAYLSARVPAAKFSAALAAIGRYGKVLSRNTQSQDVTATVASYEGRIKALRNSEQEYLKMLNRARTTDERLQIQRALNETRAQISSLQTQHARLKQLAQMSNLEVSFQQNVGVKPNEGDDIWWKDSWTGAGNATSFIWERLGRGVIYLVMLAPIWIPLGLIYLWWRRRQA